MKDKYKTKEALINELEYLRKRLADLEKSEIGLKHSNQSLKENEERYRTFFETSKDCIFITSKDGKWINSNQAAVDFFAYETKTELLKTPLSQFLKAQGPGKTFLK